MPLLETPGADVVGCTETKKMELVCGPILPFGTAWEIVLLRTEETTISWTCSLSSSTSSSTASSSAARVVVVVVSVVVVVATTPRVLSPAATSATSSRREV